MSFKNVALLLCFLFANNDLHADQNSETPKFFMYVNILTCEAEYLFFSENRDKIPFFKQASSPYYGHVSEFEKYVRKAKELGNSGRRCTSKTTEGCAKEVSARGIDRIKELCEKISMSSLKKEDRTPIDNRFKSPEKTWKTFIGYLKSGDKAGAINCFTPNGKSQIESVIGMMSKNEMEIFASNLSDFKAFGKRFGSFSEGVVNRGGSIFFVYFYNVDQEWKIHQM